MRTIYTNKKIVEINFSGIYMHLFIPVRSITPPLCHNFSNKKNCMINQANK